MNTRRMIMLSAFRNSGGTWVSAVFITVILIFIGATFADPPEGSPSDAAPGLRKGRSDRSPEASLRVPAFVRAKLPKLDTQTEGLTRPPDDHPQNARPTFAGIPFDDISLPPGYPEETAAFADPETGELTALNVINLEEEGTGAAESAEAANDDDMALRFFVRLGEGSSEDGLALPFPLATDGLIDYRKRAIRVTLPRQIGRRFLIQYSADGNSWEELGEHQAGVFVDTDPIRSDEPSGYYLISVLEAKPTSQAGGLR